MNIQLVRENLEYRKSARYGPLSSLPTAVELELICIVHLQQVLCAIFRVAFGRKICVFFIFVVSLHFMYNPTCVSNCKMTK
jgi:hypothetical protein